MIQPLTAARLWCMASLKRREFYLLLLVLIMGFALRMAFLHEPFERDEGVYSTIGQQILRGDIPYRDAVEIKTPGILYLYAAMISLVGPSMEGIRILTAFYSMATTCAIFWLARNIAGPVSGLWAAFFFALFSGAPRLQGSSSNSEVFMLLPAVLTICMLIAWIDSDKRRYLVFSGIFAGLTLVVKTVAAPLMLLLGLIVMFRPSTVHRFSGRVVDAMIFGLPFIIISGLIAIYFHTHNALDDLIYWCFTFMQRYRSPVLFSQYPAKFLLTHHLVILEHLFLWLAGLPAMVWFLYSRRDIKIVLSVCYLAAAIVGVCLPGFFYPHYYIQLMPPLAILAGLGTGAVWELRGKVRFSVPAVVFISVVGYFAYDYAFYFVYTPEEVSTHKYGAQGIWFSEARNIGAYINRNSTPDDSIFQWGFEPEVYFYADRKITNKYNTHIIVQYSQNPFQASYELMWNLAKNRPKYIIVYEAHMDAPGYESIELVLKQYYQFIGKWRGGVNLYKRIE